MLRPLEQQFEKDKLQIIENLISDFEAMKKINTAAKYYFFDLIKSLEAGALLSALLTATAVLELFIRNLAAYHLSETGIEFSEWKIEDKRYLGFSKLVKALIDSNKLNSHDGERAVYIYDNVRIPLQHGLVQRFVEFHSSEIFNILRPKSMTDSNHFEEIIEKFCFRYLDEIGPVNFSV